MRVLITGGAGFIGSHLAEALLQDGHAVTILDNLSTGRRENIPQGATFVEVDLRDAQAVNEAFQQARPEAVSHQAAQMSVSRSVREPGFDAEVNIVGLVNTLSASVAQGVQRFVFASSGGVMYGETIEPADEQVAPDPQSPYGISKWTGERYLQFFHRQHGLASAALRYANVYGERQNPEGEAGVVAIFSTRMLQQQPATVNGDGKYIRDYVHVSDVVAANSLALTRDLSGAEAFNVGTGRATDVNELGARISSLCAAERARRGLESDIPALQHGPARPGDLRSNLVSYQKLQQKTGWTPGVSLEEGLARTVGWFADQLLSSG